MINNSNYIYGEDDLKVPSHLNFGKFMLDRLRQYKDEIALVNSKTGEELSYKEFTQYAVNLAKSLSDMGIKKGDTVAFGSEKRNDFMATALAIVFTGATYTPVEFQNGRATLRHKLNITKPKYFICSELFWNSYKDIINALDSIKTVITLDEKPKSVVSVKSLISKSIDVNLFEPAEVLGQTDVAFILYSSGTTGISKGIMLTHQNCILNSITDYFLDESLKVAWIEAEWYHNYDAFVTCAFLTLGRKIVYHPEYTTETLVQNINDYKVNIAMLVPSTAIFLSKADIVNKYDMDSLKIIYSGSAPLHAKTIYSIKKRFPNLQNFFQRYGMTEVGVLSSEFWGTKGPKVGSNGMPSRGITLKIVDPITHEVLGPNQRGEICVRGPALMKGYIGIDRNTYMDEHGFFKTGDLGYYDDDHYLYIIDRLKEIINFNGYKVPPLELETILLLHPDVREAGVVGKPDPELYELPTAFVVRQPGSTVTEEELVNYIAYEVTHYMQLKGGVRFISELPRNPRKKIMRSHLREMLKNESLNQSIESQHK